MIRMHHCCRTFPDDGLDRMEHGIKYLNPSTHSVGMGKIIKGGFSVKKAYLILMAAFMLLFGAMSVSADPGIHQPQSHAITAASIDVVPAMATDVQPQVFSAELEQVYGPTGFGGIKTSLQSTSEDSTKPRTIYVTYTAPLADRVVTGENYKEVLALRGWTERTLSHA